MNLHFKIIIQKNKTKKTITNYQFRHWYQLNKIKKILKKLTEF